MAKRFRKTIRDPSTLGKRRGGRGSVRHFDVELDLHGLTGDEAVAEVEKTLYSMSEESVLIIHGKGDGVLRRRVRALLDEVDLVSRVEFGEDCNLPGGAGVTVAWLD